MFKKLPARFALLFLLTMVIMPINRLHAQSTCAPQQDPPVLTDPGLSGTDSPDTVTGSDPVPPGEPDGALLMQVVASSTLLGVRLS